MAAGWLLVASLFFYGWWDYRYLPLLTGSICFNYWCSGCIRSAGDKARMRWLTGAVAANLCLLAYYKYAGFFLSALSDISGHSFPALHILLPIGISFFTFTQIAFLVDTAQGKVNEARFLHYGLFVTYFPHLIAGPVLHHKEMMPQFADLKNYTFSPNNFAVGFTIFVIGLAKKVLIADNLAPYANQIFDHPGSPSFFVTWGWVLAYAFQLYFDFSGYSDMAIGLSRLFGVRLPLNFDSPYKAHNIIEFWRRWHMTLSRFLRDYLYIALGGSRLGTFRRFTNLMITMVLGGLWHGAGWKFIIWGALHGVFLVINHAFQALGNRFKRQVPLAGTRPLSTALTFIAVCFAWVFFRAADVHVAVEMVHAMIGGAGVAIPSAVGNRLGPLQAFFENAGVTFFLGGGTSFIETWSLVLVAAIVAFAAPNTQEIMRRFAPALDFHFAKRNPAFLVRKLEWQPSPRWALYIAVLTVACVLALNRPSEFLYFQF